MVNFKKAVQVPRVELERKIRGILKMERFSFQIIKDASSSYLTLTEEHLKNESLRKLVSWTDVDFDEDLSIWDKEDKLQFAAETLVYKMVGINGYSLKKVLLYSKDQMVIALAV